MNDPIYGPTSVLVGEQSIDEPRVILLKEQKEGNEVTVSVTERPLGFITVGRV